MQAFVTFTASDTFNHTSLIAHDTHAQFRYFAQLDLSASLKQRLGLIFFSYGSWDQEISFALVQSLSPFQHVFIIVFYFCGKTVIDTC